MYPVVWIAFGVIPVVVAAKACDLLCILRVFFSVFCYCCVLHDSITHAICLKHSNELSKHNPMVEYTAAKQKSIKSNNRDAIILAIKEKPMRFKDLESKFQTEPKITHTTLTKHLKELMAENYIKKEARDNKIVYLLTDKGEKIYHRIFLIEKTLTEIRERDGKYISGAVPVQPKGTEPFFWPSMAHMAADKNIPKVLEMITREHLFRIQESLLHHILGNIQTKNINLDEKIEGEIVIGVSLNYSEIVKAVKYNSYSNWTKLWKKEKALTTIWMQDSLSGENKPFVLRQKILGGTK